MRGAFAFLWRFARRLQGARLFAYHADMLPLNCNASVCYNWNMPRKKLYESDAERQAAYRQRHKANSEASAADLKGQTQLETLRNVANHFKERAYDLEYPNADAE